MISNYIDKMRLLFVREKKPFLRLKAIMGFYPHNLRFYQQALIHKSAARLELEEVQKHKREGKNTPQTKAPRMNNERLEFLGDAVLGAVVADILYRHYGNKQEGFLTSLRSKLVCRSTLNKLAVDMGLDKLIRHTGAVTTAHNSFMSGNAFEAFVGAIYLDRGYRLCYRFIEEKVFGQYINIDQMAHEEQNFKSALIEWCQKRQLQFTFTQKEGHDSTNHKVPVFHSSVCIEGIPCGTGTGFTKKESDQHAAQQAMRRIKRDKQLQAGIRNAAAQKREKADKKDAEE